MEYLEFSSDPLNVVSTGALLLLSYCALYLLWTVFKASRRPAARKDQVCESRNEKVVDSNVYEDIAPWEHDSQWRRMEPLRIRPFKSRYHLTMGLESMTMGDLVAVDKTYLNRIRHRRELMQNHTKDMLACNDACVPAVQEFHTWMFGTYLPKRFPSMFERSASDLGRTRNMVTDELVTIHETSALRALQNIGSHVDTDFLLLLPSSETADDQPIYHLEAFVSCFPSGFQTREKLGLALASIHSPVPCYKAKLERSMDRYFAKIPVGTIVKRSNWTITTTDDLFIREGTHLYKGMEADEAAARDMDQQRQSIVLEHCRLRAERQTLHRLPQSKALVFAFKTYQYKLCDVKAEGDGPALAEAIAGLAQGSVPEMHYYKRGVVWGQTISAYLRSEQA